MYFSSQVIICLKEFLILSHSGLLAWFGTEYTNFSLYMFHFFKNVPFSMVNLLTDWSYINRC